MNPYLGCNPEHSIISPSQLESEIAGKHIPKHLLMYNYEDKPLHELFKNAPDRDTHKTWLGKSSRFFNLIILRDPFNNFASKYKWVLSGKQWTPSLDSLKALPPLWKSYAQLYMKAEDPENSDNLITINYNKWFRSSEYREQLAQKLQLDSTDKGLEEVAKWGPNTWGDSFDNMDYDGQATKMNVLERWKNYLEDPFFKSLFKDKMIIELSEKIFGAIPGTEVF